LSKILVIAGHGLTPSGVYDPGASANGITEAGFIRESFIPAMKKHAPSNMHFYTEKDFYSFKLANTIKGYDQIVELHLDAHGNLDAEDGHVIIHKAFKPDEIDLRIRDVVKKHVGVRGQNGFSYRDNLYNLNVFAHRGIAYRLVELAFITNKKEIEYVKKNYEAYAKDLVEAIDGQPVKSNPKPAPKQNNSDSTYTVVYGDTLWGISQKYGMTVEELKKLNGLKSDLIHPGQVLKVKLANNNPSPPKTESKEFKVGQKVKVKKTATKYATGQTIPSWVKGQTYTVQQVKSDRVLLKEIISWVYKKDVE